MAHLAIHRVNLGLMIFGIVILHLMTGNAIRLGVQHSSFMATRALYDHSVSAGQGKSCGGMIE